MKEITAEQRKEWAAKGAATRWARKQREEEHFRAEITDKENALELCRRIRDDENAKDADRLKAIELIAAIKSK